MSRFIFRGLHKNYGLYLASMIVSINICIISSPRLSVSDIQIGSSLLTVVVPRSGRSLPEYHFETNFIDILVTKKLNSLQICQVRKSYQSFISAFVRILKFGSRGILKFGLLVAKSINLFTLRLAPAKFIPRSFTISQDRYPPQKARLLFLIPPAISGTLALSILILVRF